MSDAYKLVIVENWSILVWQMALSDRRAELLSGLQLTPTEAAHVGKRGLSQKCSDREAIPLCRNHHTDGPEAVHRIGKIFWQHHAIDRDAIILELNRAFEQEEHEDHTAI